jgi:hypothetical protein
LTLYQQENMHTDVDEKALQEEIEELEALLQRKKGILTQISRNSVADKLPNRVLNHGRYN